IRGVVVWVLAGLSSALACSAPRASAGEKIGSTQQSITVQQVALTGNQYEIHFVNGHKSDIEVAIFAVNEKGEWKTNGWWVLKPGGTAFAARTKNSIFCYYARTTDGRWVWDGKDKPTEQYAYPVRDSKETFAFRKQEMNPKQFVRYTLTLVE
ncbi:MAG: DUF1036 domain-containing protein, partial [Gemmataceae bacterium]